MSLTDPRIDSLKAAISKAGSQSAMARLLGITQASVWGWLKRGTPLPAEHVLTVERELGISRHRLRPDLYPREFAAANHHHPDRDDRAGRLEPVR